MSTGIGNAAPISQEDLIKFAPKSGRWGFQGSPTIPKKVREVSFKNIATMSTMGAGLGFIGTKVVVLLGAPTHIVKYGILVGAALGSIRGFLSKVERAIQVPFEVKHSEPSYERNGVEWVLVKAKDLPLTEKQIKGISLDILLNRVVVGAFLGFALGGSSVLVGASKSMIKYGVGAGVIMSGLRWYLHERAKNKLGRICDFPPGFRPLDGPTDPLGFNPKTFEFRYKNDPAIDREKMEDRVCAETEKRVREVGFAIIIKQTITGVLIGATVGYLIDRNI